MSLGASAAPAGPDQLRRGTAYGFLAYGIWGSFPLYFHALKPAGAWEILAHRIVWTFVICAAVLTALRDWAWVRPTLRHRRLAVGLALAATFIAANWVIYVIAVLSGHTYEAALGYFLNPIVTVALGVVVLGERLRRLQWIAVSVGAVAAAYLTLAGGSFPWIALSLASSFGMYGLLKKRVGASLTAMQSLFAETAVLVPAALVILAVVAARGQQTYGSGGVHTTLLTAAGVVTAIPLLLFAAAARRIPLVTVGLIQFITPVLQLLVGVLVLNEHVTGQLWAGFGIVWLALVLLSTDSLVAVGRGRRALPVREPGSDA